MRDTAGYDNNLVYSRDNDSRLMTTLAYSYPAAEIERAGLVGPSLLLLWGLSIGIPDLRYTVSDIVNVRLDDLFTALMFLGQFFFVNHGRRYTPLQRGYLLIFILLVFICIFSLYMSFVSGQNPSLYRIAHLIGITFAFFAIPPFMSDDRSVKFLMFGLTLGGAVCFLPQVVHYDFAHIGSMRYTDIKAQLDSSASWNDNTFGTLAVIWAAFAAWSANELYNSKIINIAFNIAAVFFGLVPFLYFTRTAAVANCIMLVVLLVLKRKPWLLTAALCILALIWLAYTYFMPEPYVKAIADLDPEKGASSLKRLGLWINSIHTSLAYPLGIGFGNEVPFMRMHGLRYISHNEYLSAYVELGLVGGTVFLISIVYWPYAFIKLMKSEAPVSRHAKYMFSLALAIIFMMFFMPGFYFEKPGAFAQIVLFGVMGWMERKIAITSR